MSATILNPASYAASPATPSNRAGWASRIMTGVVVLFLVFDLTLKLFFTEAAAAGSVGSASRRDTSSS
jgi:hypothetical protein